MEGLQTYDDGSEARWIGRPDSDNPAAITDTTSSATRENAGGEGASADGEDASLDPLVLSAAVGGIWFVLQAGLLARRRRHLAITAVAQS